MAGKNGSRSNYADKPGAESMLVEHHLRFGDEKRAYTPTSGEADMAGHFGGLSDGATGDWSWKPARDRAAGYGPSSTFATFHGVPASAAELYRGQVFARA